MRLIDKIRTARQFLKQYFQWKRLKDDSNLISINSCNNKFVIVPCDPESVGGSRGDEAMIIATIQQFRTLNPLCEIHIVVSGENGEEYVKGLPFEKIYFINSWNGSYPLERIYRSVLSIKPSRVVILGADCMDGFYSPIISLTLLALHDLFSHTEGVKSVLLGFSYNDRPSKLMNWAFSKCDNSTVFRLRDSISQNRFESATGKSSFLVADQAFMLVPSYDFDGFRNMQKWVDEKKQEGKTIIGFNFHPMLKKYATKSEIHEDANILAKNLSKILRQKNDICLVLIPHDNRVNLGDNVVLSTIDTYLKNNGHDGQVYYDSKVYRALELKGLCSLLDGLVSSRMHLAIAALGMGKPVMVADYQGKFEGLIKHFDMPLGFVLTPDVFVSDAFVDMFGRFNAQIDNMRTMIHHTLPTVSKLSEKNLFL